MILKVFLDANILYSNTVRSLFIWFHINRIVKIYWSRSAWGETFKSYAAKNDVKKSESFRASMQKNAIDNYVECMVSFAQYSPVGLKDVDDEHIVGAAAQAQVDWLITFDKVLLGENLKNLKSTNPDDFIMDNIVPATPVLLVAAMRDHMDSLKSKPTKSDYLMSLRLNNIDRFAAWLDQNIE